MGSAFCTNGCCSSYSGGRSLVGKTFPVQPGFHRVPFLLEGLRHRARFLVGQANWRGSGRDAGSAWGVHGGGLPGACFHSHGRKRRLGRRRRAGIRTRGWRAAGAGRVPRSGCRGQRSSGPRFLRAPGPLAGRLLGGRCFLLLCPRGAGNSLPRAAAREQCAASCRPARRGPAPAPRPATAGKWAGAPPAAPVRRVAPRDTAGAGEGPRAGAEAARRWPGGSWWASAPSTRAEHEAPVGPQRCPAVLCTPSCTGPHGDAPRVSNARGSPARLALC